MAFGAFTLITLRVMPLWCAFGCTLYIDKMVSEDIHHILCVVKKSFSFYCGSNTNHQEYNSILQKRFLLNIFSRVLLVKIVSKTLSVYFVGLPGKKQQIHALNLLVLLLPNVHRNTLGVSTVSTYVISLYFKRLGLLEEIVYLWLHILYYTIFS